MKPSSPWTSGAIELLRHADSHMALDGAFDKRIAFISVDNSVETMIRTYLALPRKKSGIKVSKKDLEATGNSFPGMLDLLEQHAKDKLVGVDITEIEMYHRIRNKLYHDGTGLSVDEQHLKAYRGIAEVLLENLYGETSRQDYVESEPTENFLLNWNLIEKTIRSRLEAAGIKSTQKWEEAFVEGLLDKEDAKLLNSLKKARNQFAHATQINKNEVNNWLDSSKQILNKYPAIVEFDFKRVRITSELHEYSLLASVTLNQTPDQDFFRVSLFWPKTIPVSSQKGFEIEEEQIINNKTYKTFSLFVEKRLWPGQTMKIIGGRAAAQLNYQFNEAVFDTIDMKATNLYYQLYLQSWQPVKGHASFSQLNEF